jgi:hypothetical protein
VSDNLASSQSFLQILPQKENHQTPPSSPKAMSAPNFANFVIKRPWLQSMLRPLSNWYVNAASYRRLGLR